MVVILLVNFLRSIVAGIGSVPYSLSWPQWCDNNPKSPFQCGYTPFFFLATRDANKSIKKEIFNGGRVVWEFFD